MDCPVCSQAMITLEMTGVEVDYCVQCRGLWLDAGELELLINDKAAATRLIASFRRTTGQSEQARPCPICDRKMEKVLVGPEQPALLIDRCIKGHGLWFDEGELRDILDRAELDEHSRIKRYLAEMFGHDT